MANTPKKVKVDKPDPVPTPAVEPTCPNCKFSMQHKTQLVCNFPLPPHISVTGRVPYVHNAFTCGLFKQG